MADKTELEQHLEAQAKEYGTYVAASPIFYNGARAFNAGDPVPVSHVEAYGYDKETPPLVVKVGTKAAEKVVTPAQTEG